MERDPNDPHDLKRFLDAQQNTYGQAISELRMGKKRTHWMWFIFPQFAGLGFSGQSKLYAIKSLDEARAYLEHPILGPRLVDAAKACLEIEGRSAPDVFGWPDDMKLRSSMTLFSVASSGETVFHDVLAKFFDGKPDGRTVELIERQQQ